MPILDRGFKEILLSQIVSIIGWMVAGILLVVYLDQLFLIPGVLILLPGLLEMQGNISGTFAARLSSGLFLGVIKPNRMHTKLIHGNIFASFFLAIFTALILGVVAFLFNLVIFSILTPEIILIPLIASFIASIIEIPLVLSATIFLFKKGHDPNNIIGPFITSTADIIGVISLLIAMVVV